MATDLEQKAPPKHEAFVEKQLDQVRRRIRALDTGSNVLWLVAVTLAYGLIIAVIDRTLGLGAGGTWGAIRIGAFLLYLVFAGFFLISAGLCLYRRINPYYAAKKLEESVPDAKNSVVNWLDLREEKLPTVIRQTLGQRAAKDLKKADPEKAVAGSKAVLLVSIVAGLVLAALILFLMGPHQFGSLMQRAFLPFRDVNLATRTYITLLEPRGGNVTVGINTPVRIRAQIDGHVPKITHPAAPKLHYRYNQTDEFTALNLESVADGTWNVQLSGDQIQSGLWYKITAGDAATAQYQIQVRTFPAILRWEVSYKHRPYLKHLDFSVNFPNPVAVFPRIRAVTGTEVEIIAFTNRNVQSGWLKVTTDKLTKDFAGEPVNDDPKAIRFKFPIERTGSFVVSFTSKENETNSDQTPFPIDIIPDGPPTVVLTKPGKDIELPANDLLQLEGHADDDLGLKQLLLRMKVIEGEAIPALEPKPYRPGKQFGFVNGSFPTHLDYKDTVPLDQLKTQAGEAFPAKAGMVIEYWLEAIDNSDYPNKAGDIGRSASYKVKILEPEKDSKQQQQKKQKAEQDQQQHEKKQDKELNQQNKEAEQKQQEQKDQKQGKGESKKQDQQSKGEAKGQEKTKDPELEKQREKVEDIAKRAEDQLNKEKQKGEAKPAEPKSEKDKGDPKQQPKDGSKDKSTEPKEDGKQPKEGQPKEGGQGSPKNGEKQEGKAADKAEPKAQPKPDEKGKGTPEAKAKDAGAKGEKGEPKTENKKTDPKETQGAGKAKTDEKKTETKAVDGEDKKGKERAATPEEIEKLEKDAQKSDKKGEEALNELRRLSKEAADPKVREAAKEALDRAGKTDTAQPKDGGPKEKSAKAEPKDKGDGKQEPGKEPDKTASKGEPKEMKKGEGKAGPKDQTAGQTTEDPKGPDADPELSKRAGNLTLEELKNKMTPELLKKAGISEAEWQAWLKDVAAYQKMLANRGLTDVRGKGSKLPSVAPRQITPGVNEDSLQNIRTQPPPELRDAYRQFTDPGSPKKK